MEFDKLPCSFRDPSGFLFRKDDVLYRQINSCYKDNYQTLKNSGLYTDLIDKGLLVTHEEVKVEPEGEHGYLTIRPDELPFISYPYEWSFSQLKESALLTLKIQQLAMNKGFSLKDASSYNVQLQRGKPIFIDTLSFEKLNPSEPWIAYKQFCQHFLAPLALMAKKDISLNQLLRTNIDGIPLLLASKLLPLRTRMNFSLAIHLHLHARMQSKFADQDLDVIKHRKKFSRNSLNGIIDSLVTAVSGLNWQPKDTEWHDYYDSNNNYNNEALLSKEIIVREFLDKQSNRSTWDLGANTGRFSRLAAQYSEYVCAWDIDPACVEINYRTNCKNGVGNVYPLLLDLTNPSPAIGWNNCERAALKERGPADLTLALGIIHHLSIANNLSFEMIASFLADITHTLIIEFIQKTDSQVKKLLRNRTDIFPEYNQDNFEHVFSEYFNTLGKKQIPGTERIVYLMQTPRA